MAHVLSLDGPGPGDAGMGALFALFMFVFFAAFAVAIVIAVFKFVKTREMAMHKGASGAEATAVALSGDVGTAAAFVKQPAPGEPATVGRSLDDRIAAVNDLRERGLITPAQADARVAEILAEI